jgi:hypothetical protein
MCSWVGGNIEIDQRGIYFARSLMRFSILGQYPVGTMVSLLSLLQRLLTNISGHQKSNKIYKTYTKKC